MWNRSLNFQLFVSNRFRKIQDFLKEQKVVFKTQFVVSKSWLRFWKCVETKLVMILFTLLCLASLVLNWRPHWMVCFTTRCCISTQEWSKQACSCTPKHLGREGPDRPAIQSAALGFWLTKASYKRHRLLRTQSQCSSRLPSSRVHNDGSFHR